MVHNVQVLEHIVANSWTNLSRKIGLNCFGTFVDNNSGELDITITLLGSKHDPQFDSDTLERVIHGDDEILLQTNIYIPKDGEPEVTVLEENTGIEKNMVVTYEYNKIIPQYLSTITGYDESVFQLYRTSEETIQEINEFKERLGKTARPLWRTLQMDSIQEIETFYADVARLAEKYIVSIPAVSEKKYRFAIETYGGKTHSHNQHQEVHLVINELTPLKNPTKRKKYEETPYSLIKFYYDSHRNKWNSELMGTNGMEEPPEMKGFYEALLLKFLTYGTIIEPLS